MNNYTETGFSGQSALCRAETPGVRHGTVPAHRIYISGPMTGLPDFNYPAFHREAARLRALGYHVESPAENPPQADWSGYMQQALKQMLACDAVAFLPGWAESRGALLERYVAGQVGLAIIPASAITEGLSSWAS